MQPINGYLPVIVPADAHSFEIYDKESLPLAVMCYSKQKFGELEINVPVPVIIPPGSYTVAFKGCDATEEQAREVVDNHEFPMTRDIAGYEDYMNIGFELFDTALESLHSLCYSLGGTPETTLFLKIKEQ